MTSPTVRRAWLVGGSLLAAVGLVVGTARIVGALAHVEETEVATFPAAGVDVLDIRSPQGTIDVRGGDVDEITVTAEISHGLRPTGHTATVAGGVLRVRASCPLFVAWCEVDYRVEVPAGVDVVASTDDGRLIVRDVTGDVRADGDNGSLELTRLAGDLDVTTGNGRVDATGLRSPSVRAGTENGSVRLEFAEPPAAVEATSRNGRVDVVVPDTPDAYRVDLGTHNGATDVGVRTDPSSDRSVVASTHNGDVTVRYPTG